MIEAHKIPMEETVECQICLKEVPVSEANSDEARDYVFHFCGIECYGKWQEQEKQQ
ncbi:MAG: DUF3330 domain-containing protein [Gammaproteobacteria bacterium]|nr:DUF3330 domain-containing protein [Gammaproteobacteria bacterium]